MWNKKKNVNNINLVIVRYILEEYICIYIFRYFEYFQVVWFFEMIGFVKYLNVFFWCCVFWFFWGGVCFFWLWFIVLFLNSFFRFFYYVDFLQQLEARKNYIVIYGKLDFLFINYMMFFLCFGFNYFILFQLFGL